MEGEDPELQMTTTGGNHSREATVLTIQTTIEVHQHFFKLKDCIFFFYPQEEKGEPQVTIFCTFFLCSPTNINKIPPPHYSAGV